MLAIPHGKDTEALRKAGMERITGPVQASLSALDGFLGGEVVQFEREVQELVQFCLGHSGKRIRPVLVFHSGRSDGAAEADPELVKLAAVIELVHLATLVHDDVLDVAALRHGQATVAEKYGGGVAVLLGDALFAHALQLAASFPTAEVCREVARATRQVCTGEIAQTFQRGRRDLSLADYGRIIELKTAELFAVSCRLGGRLGGFSKEEVAALSEYGLRLGNAYQIFDDLADFLGEEARIGKTLGTDLASGKWTLPLILLREACGEEEAARLVDGFGAGEDGAATGRLLEALRSHGVLARSREHFEAEVRAAETALGRCDDREGVRSLGEISAYVRGLVDRLA